ncbi:hypothetical protein [Megasphaera sp.]|uniref:crAss001_48 related protein n=1 Tax=Megasphaera sp. TaxID=2023260 RepID=UPI00307A297C
MNEERMNLAYKHEKLIEFLRTRYAILDQTELHLMREQARAMDDYIKILDARIAHAVLKEQLKCHSLIG